MAEDAGRSSAHCGRCGHEVDIVLVIEPDHEVHRRLARIERALGIIHQEEEQHMGEIDDRLADLKVVADTNSGKLARLITDFESKGELTDDQRAALDALKAEIVGNSDAIDAADPNTADNPPDAGTPVDGDEEPAPAE